MVEDKDILKNETIVVIASISWNMQWQGHHKLTFWWARHAKRVIYIDNMPKRMPGFRELGRIFKRVSPLRNRSIRSRKHRRSLDGFKNIDIISSLLLPSVNRVFNWINKKVYLKKLAGIIKSRSEGQRPIVWCFLPSKSAKNLIDHLDPKLLIYNASDNYQAGRDAPRDIVELETFFIKKADIVAVTSDYLYEQKRKIREDIHMVPEGVNFKLYQTANTGFFKGAVKRACYFGGVNRQRINIDLVNALGRSGVEVWIIGPVRDSLPKLDGNIKLIPTVEHEKLPELLAGCDCLILPYNINEFTDGIMPAKVFECFATGKPIISTPIKNLKKFSDIIALAGSEGDFVDAVKSAGRLDTVEKYNKRIEIARSRSEEHEYDGFIGPILEKIKN